MKKELEDYVDVFREFETKKRSIQTNQQKKVVITLPLSLTMLVKKQHTKFENAVAKSRHKMDVSYKGGKFYISPKTSLHRVWPFLSTCLETGCKSASHSGQL
jgi:hypothetical protein